MVTIKDFKKGQTAYLVKEAGGRLWKAEEIRTVTIEKVGNKYVHADNCVWEATPLGADYLLEKINRGWVRKLFLTEEDMKAYEELKELRGWWHTVDVSNLSLQQLRVIKQIVETEGTNGSESDIQ